MTPLIADAPGTTVSELLSTSKLATPLPDTFATQGTKNIVYRLQRVRTTSALANGSNIGSRVPSDGNDTLMNKLQGDWLMQQYTHNPDSGAVEPSMPTEAMATVRGTHIRVSSDTVYRIEPESMNGSDDQLITFFGGRSNEDRDELGLPGILRVEADAFMICHANSREAKRPTEFKANPDAYLLKFQRYDGLAKLLDPADSKSVVEVFLNRAKYKRFKLAAELCSRDLVNPIEVLENAFAGYWSSIEFKLKSGYTDDLSNPQRAIFFCEPWWTHRYADYVSMSVELKKEKESWFVTRAESLNEEQEKQALKRFLDSASNANQIAIPDAISSAINHNPNSSTSANAIQQSPQFPPVRISVRDEDGKPLEGVCK